MSRDSGKQDGGEPQAEAILKDKLARLPAAPGVYLHKNQDGKVIYVGKAARLNQRVRSYFQAGAAEGDGKTLALVRKIRDFDYIVTDSEAAALVLENQLIKEYRPAYNVRLRDDKQYPYIRISLAEAYPRVSVVRRLEDDGARYFGPYTDVKAMRAALSFAAGAFQVRTCHLDLPDPQVVRPCLDWQIGRCSAPCVGYDDRQQYGQKALRMARFLGGRDRELLADLARDMERLAADLKYEQAGRVRDLIAKLGKTAMNQRPVAGIHGDCDLCGLVRDGVDASGVVLRVRGGHLLTAHHFLLRDRLERGVEAFLAQLLREYYPRAGDIPGEVLLSHDLADRPAWAGWLASLRGRPVKLAVPLRGARKEAVELARTNAACKLREAAMTGRVHAVSRAAPAENQLQDALDLHTAPQTIECFDISNFQGRETVGSLVYFKEGRPLTSRYRRFRIRLGGDRSDDFASLAEVLDRYYGRLTRLGQAPADLVMVDGGAGQLSTARRVLAAHGLHAAQVIGLAKRLETIHREGGTVQLPKGSEGLKLLQRVRDEAHRFAITYHRLLRDRRTTASELDLIPGIGQAKKLSLLHAFGSVARIGTATAAELAAVRLISPRDAAAIVDFFARRGGGRS